MKTSTTTKDKALELSHTLAGFIRGCKTCAEILRKAAITEANAGEAHTAETLRDIAQQYEDLANGKQ